MNKYDDLNKLKQLRESGVLSESEYEQQKQVLLNRSDNQGFGGADGQKSWITAVLLALFLGSFGIDRFYLGYTGIGVLKLLTVGCLGLLTLIDFIRIITKSLQPADGKGYAA
ncbi:MAG: NINE protein [Oscillospiraceae bacterium]|jgi:TM2 domain-containing membrane protein YozV|nr:NINE protein [Oscillospiraceae bacterium]